MNDSLYNLGDKRKQQDSPDVLWVSSETNAKFLRHLPGKEETLMERLQILTAGAQRVFKPSLRNLPARLSTPVALLVLNSFIFRISTELTFSNLSFFS